MGVTKTHSKEVIKESFECGVRFFGENKVQEAEKKYTNKPKESELHLIGRLQTNKINKAIRLFDVIQSVDSLKLVKNINKRALIISKIQRIFCQINIGKDPKKTGFTVKELECHVEQIKNFSHLKFEGIMTILPNNINEKTRNKFFAKTKKTADKINKVLNKPIEISMGMSGDYVEAIKNGATIVRVGSKLYGSRK